MAIRTNCLRYGVDTVVDTTTADTVFTAASGGTVFTDETTDAHDSGTADVPLSTAVNDALYIGCDLDFTGVSIDMSTNASGGTRVVEYSQGSGTFASLTATFVTGGVLLNGDTVMTFTPPADWVADTVNGVSRKWIRFRTTVVHTTAGTITQINTAKYIKVMDGRTLDVPETTSRTFRSVYCELRFTTSAPSDFRMVRLLARLGGSGAFTLALDQVVQINPVGENTTMVVRVDLTAQFNSGFGAGASQTIDLQAAVLQVTVGSAPADNLAHWCGELILTYDADDSASTQVKTLVLPFDSLTGALTTSQQTIGGTGALRALTGFVGLIQEAGPTIKDLYIVFAGNADEAGTTDWSFVGQIDSEAETTLASYDAASQSDFEFFLVWRRTDLNTAIAHDLKARVTSVTGATVSNVGGYVVVTYTYDHAGSSFLTHQIVRPIEHNPGLSTGTASTAKQKSTHTIHVPGANAALLHGGIGMALHQSADPGNYLLAIGGQTERSYSAPAATVSGPAWFHQRFDADGVAGSGITFARGFVTLTITSRVDTTLSVSGGESGWLYLTYSATKDSDERVSYGLYLLRGLQLAVNGRISASFSVPIPEASPFLTNASVVLEDFSNEGGFSFGLRVQKASNDGWFVAKSVLYAIDNTLGSRFTVAPLPFFTRYPGDPDTGRVSIETARDWVLEGRVQPSSVARPQAVVQAEWHDYAFTTTVDVDGFLTGDGSGLTVDVYRTDTKELVKSATTAAGGTAAITWHDDTVDCYAVVVKDADEAGCTPLFNFGD